MNTPAKSLVIGKKSPEDYEDLLKKSISDFLSKYPKRGSKILDLHSKSKKWVEELNDPSLGTICFHVAMEFHKSKPSVLEPLMILLGVKDLLQLINSCSSLCGVVKKIAAIAPILYLLYHFELRFSADDLSLRKEIGSVVEGIVSHISICCSQFLVEGGKDLDGLGVPILDLTRVWTVDHIRGNRDADVLAAFFPILDEEFQQESKFCLGYLAGVVMIETFFFRLYFKIAEETNKEDLEKIVLKLAVQTLKGFHYFYFVDMLLKTLLEPNLPIAALLSPENAFILQKALYDAVMIEYSFYSGRWVQSDECQYKQLAIHWVLVVNRAIIFAGATGDNSRATSYLLSFYDSPLVSGLINWARLQAGIMEEIVGADFSTPEDLIRWLMFLEHHGIKVFDDSSSMLHALAALSQTTWEESDSTTQLRLSPPYLIDQVMISDGGRKRKEQLSDLQESKVKQAKLDFVGTSVDDGLLNGSAVNKDTEEEEEEDEEDYYYDDDDDDDDMDLTE